MDLGLPPHFRLVVAGGFFLDQVSRSRGQGEKEVKRQRSPSALSKGAWLERPPGKRRNNLIKSS